MALHLKLSPLYPRNHFCNKGVCPHRCLDCGCCRFVRVSFACSLWCPPDCHRLRLQLSCRISRRACADMSEDRQSRRRMELRRRCPSSSPILSKKTSSCLNSRNENVVDEDFLDRSGAVEFDDERISIADDFLSEDDRSSNKFDKNLTPSKTVDQLRRATSEVELTEALSSAESPDEMDGSSEQQVHVAWVQKRFLKLVRPIIRVLNGSNFKKREDIEARTRRNENTASWSLLRMLTGSLPPGYHRRRIGEKLRQAEDDFFIFASQLGKFLFIMMATGAILATGFQLAGGDSQQETILWFSWLAGIITGSMIGAEKVMQQRCRSGSRNVVITGRSAEACAYFPNERKRKEYMQCM